MPMEAKNMKSTSHHGNDNTYIVSFDWILFQLLCTIYMGLVHAGQKDAHTNNCGSYIWSLSRARDFSCPKFEGAPTVY